MKIVIEGEPIAKKRPRFTHKNGYVHVYDSQDDCKKIVKFNMETQLRLAKYDDDKKIAQEALNLAAGAPFDVDMTFYLPIAKSGTEVKKNTKAWNIEKPNVKPDTDNLVKFYFDCGNNILWKDDKQIISICARKKYSYKPRVEINIMVTEKPNVFKQSEEILGFFSPDEHRQVVKVFSELIQHIEIDGEYDQIAVLLFILSSFHKKFKKINEKFPNYIEELKKYINKKVTNEKE